MNINRFQNIYLNAKPQANNEAFAMKVEDMTFSALLKNKSNMQLKVQNTPKNTPSSRFSKPNTDRSDRSGQFSGDGTKGLNSGLRAGNAQQEMQKNEDMSSADVSDKNINALHEENSKVAKSSSQSVSKKLEDGKQIIKKFEELQEVDNPQLKEVLAAFGQILVQFEEMQEEFDLEGMGLDEISALLENISLLQNADFSAQDLQKLSEMAMKLQENAGKFSEILEQHKVFVQGEMRSDESLAMKIEELLEELNAHGVEISQMKKSDVSVRELPENTNLDVNPSLEEESEEAFSVQNRGEQANVGAYAEHREARTSAGDAAEENTLEDFKNVIEVTNRDLKSAIAEKAVASLHRNVSAREIYSQIKEGMSKLDINGNLHEIVIKLKPEELGKVELKLELYKDFIIAKFDVENQAVKEAIESNLKDLRSSLEQSGFNNMQFDVNVGKGEQDEQDAPKQTHFTRTRAQSDIELNEGIQGMNTRRSLNSMIEETSFEYLA